MDQLEVEANSTGEPLSDQLRRGSLRAVFFSPHTEGYKWVSLHRKEHHSQFVEMIVVLCYVEAKMVLCA